MDLITDNRKSGITGILVKTLIVSMLIILMSGTISATGVADRPVSFVNFSSSFSHSLAVASDGTVWAWGDNSRGEVSGDEAYAGQKNVLQPVKVNGLTNIVGVAAGNYFSLALTSDGYVWSWGDNSRGQLGIGQADNDLHSTPTQVPGFTGVKTIIASFSNAMALKDDSTAWAWGSNVHGESGDGKPIDVPPGSGDNNAYANQNRPYPVCVSGLVHVVSIAFAGANGLALKDDGAVWGWGMSNELLGDWWDKNKDAFYTSTPVQIASVNNALKIAGYGSAINALVLKSDGTVWTWGKNKFGALGTGNEDENYYALTPAQVDGLSDIKDVASGYYSLALSEDGKVWAWGWGKWSGTGNDSINLYTPVAVPGIENVENVYAGGYSNFAIDQDGKIWAWGDDNMGQLGDGRSGDDVYIDVPTMVLPGFAATVATPSPTMTPTASPVDASSPANTTTETPSALPSTSVAPAIGFEAGCIMFIMAVWIAHRKMERPGR